MMKDTERIEAIFDELERAPERQGPPVWNGEILCGAILICLTLLFWPDIRVWLAALLARLSGG